MWQNTALCAKLIILVLYINLNLILNRSFVIAYHTNDMSATYAYH